MDNGALPLGSTVSGTTSPGKMRSSTPSDTGKRRTKCGDLKQVSGTLPSAFFALQRLFNQNESAVSSEELGGLKTDRRSNCGLRIEKSGIGQSHNEWLAVYPQESTSRFHPL